MTDFVLWLHILAAGTWFGANVIEVFGPAMMRRGGPAAEAAWWRATADFGARVYTPAAIISLLTGVELVRSLGWSYGDPFVVIGIIMVVVGAAFGMAIVGPGGRQLADAIEGGDTATSATLTTRLRAVGGVDTVLVLFTIYAMVAKLGA